MKKVVFLIGPTGVGKSSISIDLATKISSEIISADSMQIYRHMNIGTNKISLVERKLIPHYFIDIIDPKNSSYSVYDFQRDCIRIIEDIHNRNKTPIIVGGSGLYIWSILNPLTTNEIATDKKIRESIEKEIEEKGIEKVYKKLCKCSPKITDFIHRNDKKRIIRALEIYFITKKPIYSFWKVNYLKNISPIIIGINEERKVLYDLLDKRCDKMIKKGIIDEIRYLIDLGCMPQHNSMKGIGYRHFLPYLLEKGKYSLNDTISSFKRDTRRFAKRQYTFFRNKIHKSFPILWVEKVNIRNIEKILKKSYTII